MAFVEHGFLDEHVKDYHKLYDAVGRLNNIRGPYIFREYFVANVITGTVFVRNYRKKTIYVPFKFNSLEIKLIPHDK